MLRRGIALASVVAWNALVIAGSGPEDLWAAARKGDAELVKALLAKGVDVNAKTEYGATALSFAADKGHAEVVKVLLDKKADVNVKDTYYKATPLSWAVSKGHLDIAKLLVDAGAEDADAALLAAAQKGNLDLAQAALKSAKLKPAALDKALAAAPKTNAELIELLTKAGAKAADPAAKVAVKVAPEVLQSYVGAYRSDELVSQVNVALLKDRLQMKAGVFPIFTLSPIDEVKFQAAESDLVTITFVKDKEKVTGFVQKSGTTETAYRRIEARAAPPAATDDSASVTITAPANWPSFRGPNATGIADGQLPPLTWDAATGRNIRWKTPIPGLGHSCPVIWQNNIYLTTAVSGADKADLKTGLFGNVDSVIDTASHTFHVLCIDKATGKINWDKVAHTGVPKVKRHTPHQGHARQLDLRYRRQVRGRLLRFRRLVLLRRRGPAPVETRIGRAGIGLVLRCRLSMGLRQLADHLPKPGDRSMRRRQKLVHRRISPGQRQPRLDDAAR